MGRGGILLEKKIKQHGLLKIWLIRIGGFFALQLFFITIDGTFLDPKLNDIGNFAKSVFETKPFKEWLTLYDNPVFKAMTILYILNLIFQAGKDLFYPKKQDNAGHTSEYQ